MPVWCITSCRKTPRPIKGAEHLAKYRCKFHRVFDPIWRIDRTLAAGDEVVTEWSCAYRPVGKQNRMMFRGTEWYRFKAGRIAEVRAYFRYDEGRDCELADFPHAQRGYLSKDTH